MGYPKEPQDVHEPAEAFAVETAGALHDGDGSCSILRKVATHDRI